MSSELKIERIEIRLGSKRCLVFGAATLAFQTNRPLIILRGDNGVGKTSLLNILSGFTQTSRGRIWLDGTKIASRNARWSTKHGILRGFQMPLLCDELTIWENIALPVMVQWWSNPSHWQNSITRRLKDLGMEGIERSPAELSFGQRRLIEMVRIEEQSKCLQPRLLLLDEPLAGLDVERRAMVAEIILAIVGAGVPTILVEHDGHLESFGELAREVDLVAHDGVCNLRYAS